MRRLLLLACLLLAACAGPLPPKDANMAWVDMRTTGSNVLMADRLDGQRVNDGRYYQLTPGAHELLLRFQFEASRGAGLGGSESLTQTCMMRIRYEHFQAGQSYRVEARQVAMRGYGILYDAQRNVLARGKNLRCHNF